MAKLSEIASRARDLFNQDYADRNEFFDMDDFKFHCAAKYSSILNGLFQIARRENKAETGFSNVEINAQWLIHEKVVADKPATGESVLLYDDGNKRWYVKTRYNVFSFDFDSFGNGLNGIRPYGNGCNLKKISNQEIRFYDILPTTPDVYYFLEGNNRIDFLKQPTLPLTLYYIPEVLNSNNDCVMSDNIVEEVIMATLQLMFGAKNGNVVKESNDGNKNDTMQQQTNPQLNKVQQLG